MRLSVIIPAYNEETVIEATIRDLTDHHDPDEILVVDGGSADRTVELARPYARVIIAAKKGRAAQMNQGAREAIGEAFLFLHADTRLPENGLTLIRETLGRGGDAGRFRLCFDDPRWSLKLFAGYTRFHCFSYGDQGFFMQRSFFEKLAGFREDVPFEDVDFYRRAYRLTRPVILKQKVETSARRFLAMGCLRQKFINLGLVGLAFAGFNVAPLQKRFYPDIR